MQKVDIISTVIGCTLKKIPAEIKVFGLQKIVLLNMCYIKDFCPPTNLDAIEQQSD